jgi:integrase/recombinase XerD
MARRIKQPEPPRDLFTADGKRKYLTAEEREAFLAAAQEHSRGEVRAFCEVMAFTGCRISEALELTPASIDLSARAITFRTLKQRDRTAYRAVPVPESLIDTLDLVHAIRKARRRKGKASRAPLWTWKRLQAYKHVVAVMTQGGIEGPHASPKGLRHGFGVLAASETRNPRLVQKWLGHRDLATTAIYMDAVGAEERELAARMW